MFDRAKKRSRKIVYMVEDDMVEEEDKPAAAAAEEESGAKIIKIKILYGREKSEVVPAEEEVAPAEEESEVVVAAVPEYDMFLSDSDDSDEGKIYSF